MMRWAIDTPVALYAMRGGLRPYRRPSGMASLAALGHDDRLDPANARLRYRLRAAHIDKEPIR